jgi:arylsulfatase A-like enzyme
MDKHLMVLSLPRLLAVLAGLILHSVLTAADRPNILWITSEDHGPEMGLYGDAYADTPHVDALATRGLRYNFAWSTAPVCAPARTTLISGLYPPSTGGQHMRSFVPAPAGKDPYPVFLRQAGYYCTNNSKEDYNLSTPADLWDESSAQAHWKNRPTAQPFFAIFNSTVSHESQLRRRPYPAIHDPAKMPLPPYHPDIPEARQDWAQYYDTVSEADAIAGRHLADLAAAGLTEDTIVFYYSDHGAGMPSHKRNPNNRGLRVSLVVYIPEKYAHLRPADYVPGGATDRLVGFVDYAPTLLSLIGVKPPAWMQGHAFLGPYATPPPDYLFGFRGRMDERVDFVRTVTDGRYVYVRNFRPDLPAGQHVQYQMKTPTTRLWYDLFRADKTDRAQSAFWLPTPVEELYDLDSDPHEINNLIADPDHQDHRQRLASTLINQLIATHDLGFIPEAEFHRLAAGQSPYDWARISGNYDVTKIAVYGHQVTLGVLPPVAQTKANLQDPDSAIRWWTLYGIGRQPHATVVSYLPGVRQRLDDESPEVQVRAADLLVRHGNRNDARRALDRLAEIADTTQPHLPSLAALGVIDNLGNEAHSIWATVATFPKESPVLPHSRYRNHVPALLEHILDTSKKE